MRFAAQVVAHMCCRIVHPEFIYEPGLCVPAHSSVSETLRESAAAEKGTRKRTHAAEAPAVRASLGSAECSRTRTTQGPAVSPVKVSF